MNGADYNKGAADVNTCLMDGITLQNAIETLRANKREPHEILVKLGPIWLTSLACLVESIICYDRIFTSSDYVDAWGENPDLKQLLREGIIGSPDISSDVRKQLERYSEQKMIMLAKSNTFHKFVDDLVEKTTEGVILKVARHYHGFESPTITYYKRHDAIIRLDEVCQLVSQEWFDRSKSAVPQAAAIFATGAFYYRAQAAFLGIPYLPFSLRAPFCLYDDALHGKSPQAGAKLALRIMRDEASEAVNTLQSALKLEDVRWFDLDFPSIFAYVLKLSKNRSDILPCAMRIRTSNAAKDFRKELASLTASLNKGDIYNSMQAIDTIKTKAREVFRTTGLKADSKMKISFSIFETQIPLEVPIFLRRLLHKAKRTTFYHLLLTELPLVWQLDNEIRRLFDLEFPLSVRQSYEI